MHPSSFTNRVDRPSWKGTTTRSGVVWDPHMKSRMVTTSVSELSRLGVCATTMLPSSPRPRMSAPSEMEMEMSSREWATPPTAVSALVLITLPSVFRVAM